MANNTSNLTNNTIEATTPLTASDVTNTTSTLNQPYTGLIASVDTPVSTTRAITPNETVSGQLNNLIADDSKYIQSARANGLQTANGRGLLNSSIAAGAAEKAAIDAAEPIAAQDASTYAASGLSAQNANQASAEAQYNAMLKSIADQQSYSNSAGLQAQQGQITKDLQTTLKNMDYSNSSRLQQEKAASDYNLQTTLKNMDIGVDLQKLAATDRNSFSTAAQGIMQQYQSAYTSIQSQPDTVMDANAKATAIANLTAMYKPQLQSLANIYGYSLDWGTGGMSSSQAYDLQSQLNALQQQNANLQAQYDQLSKNQSPSFSSLFGSGYFGR